MNKKMSKKQLRDLAIEKGATYEQAQSLVDAMSIEQVRDTENLYIYPIGADNEIIKSSKYQDFEAIVRIYEVEDIKMVPTYDI